MRIRKKKFGSSDRLAQMEQLSQVKCGFIAIATVTITLFTLGMVFALGKTTVTINPGGATIYYSDQTMPSTLLFSSDYDTFSSVADGGWFATAIDVLQSSYRSYGIRSGFIPPDVGIEFDVNFFQLGVQNCTNRSISTEFFSGSAFAKLLTDHPDILRFVVPVQSCTNGSCGNVDSTIQGNPIDVTFIESKWGMTISDIKQMLPDSEQPLLLTIPQPFVRYTLPCSGGMEDDRESLWGRPLCGNIEFEALLPNAQFFLPLPPAVLVTGPPLTMLIYGWNDEFSMTIGHDPATTVNRSTGGFIVKLPRAADGQPITFYDRTLFYVEAQRVCRSRRDPAQWTPDVVLHCKNATFCSTGVNFSMFYDGDRQVVNELDFGMTETLMVMSVDGLNTTVNFSAIPYHFLSEAFEAINIESQNDQDLCAFWFLPYDLLERLIAMDVGRDEPPIAESFAWKWGKGSFHQKHESVAKSFRPIAPRPASTYL
jgi:hypothetical protein